MLTILLVGCSNEKKIEIEQGYNVETDMAHGLVILSAGVLKDKLTKHGYYSLFQVGSETDKWAHSIQIDYAFWDNDFENDYNNSLQIKKLPVGKYTIRKWRRIFGGSMQRSPVPFNIPFEVKAGTITYLGSVNLHVYDKNWEVVIKDESERDLNFVKKNYPFIDVNKVKVSIVKHKK